MTPEELEAIVSGGESEQVEFKRSTGQRTDGAKSVCGMLNCSGGFVLFGVTDRGEVIGQQVGASTMEELAAALRRIEPAVLIRPEILPVAADRAVIALRVPGGSYGPFTYEGRPYVRQGPTTISMPQAEYRRHLLEQMHLRSGGRINLRISSDWKTLTRPSWRGQSTKRSGGAG